MTVGDFQMGCCRICSTTAPHQVMVSFGRREERFKQPLGKLNLDHFSLTSAAESQQKDLEEKSLQPEVVWRTIFSKDCCPPAGWETPRDFQIEAGDLSRTYYHFSRGTDLLSSDVQ